MSLKIAIQMDPLERIDPKADSSYALALEAQRRGYKVFHYTPDQLTCRNGAVKAFGSYVDFYPDQEHFFSSASPETIDLKQMDVILMRQDPTHDLAYVSATFLLEKLMQDSLVLNNPVEVRNAPEKISVLQFPELIPETLMTRSLSEIKAFLKDHGDIIVKPLYGNGGSGVFRIRKEGENLNSLIEIFHERSPDLIIVQPFIPEVVEGDKRILFIDGEQKAAILRVPQKGEVRANIHVGACVKHSEFSRRDMEICEVISPFLKEKGLFFTGIDVIGPYLTEINVTSPTCIWEANALYGMTLEKDFWDAAEAKL